MPDDNIIWNDDDEPKFDTEPSVHIDWNLDREPDYNHLKRANNPHNESTGHFTGRCKKCGSKDLWDDNLAYGCNTCGAIYL